MDNPALPNWAKIAGGIALLLLVLFLGREWLGGILGQSGSSGPPPDRSAAYYLDPRTLASDPKGQAGKNIYVQGKALTVEQKGDYTWFQVMAQVSGRDFVTESVIVELRPKSTTVLKEECYRVYGTVAGTQRVKLLLTGVERDVPLLRGYAIESVPAGSLNIGCASP